MTEKKIADKNSADLHPPRYCIDGLECWYVLQRLLESKKLTPYQGYLYGCAFKYSWRLGEKDDEVKEIDKQVNYLLELKRDIIEQRKGK